MSKLFIIVNVDSFFLSHRRDIAIKAKENGYDVTIVAKDTGKRKEIETLGLNFIDLLINRSGQNVFEEIQTLFFLLSLYNREKPDIVHHVGLKTILWGTLAAKLSKINGVVNAVSGLGILFSEGKKGFLSNLLLKILRFGHNRKNIIVIFQNAEDKALFTNHHIINENQTLLIKGSGIDLNHYHYTPEPIEGKIRILFTARMIEDKGVRYLIDAAQLLKKNYFDKIQFLLCGGLDDNPKAIKKEELESVCDGDYIQWLGHRIDIFELLKSSHIVSFPSYYREGLPKSLIEAAATGKPIVTTNSIGCKDAVIDNYNGFLIPIKDSEALSDSLKKLIDNKSLRVSMGKNSRLFAEKYFSIEHVVMEHLKIYKQLLHI